MPRRTDVLIGIGFVGAAAVAVVLGQRGGANPAELDTRPSSLLAGPLGAKGLALIAERLGAEIAHRRRSLFDLEPPSPDTRTMLAVLEPAFPPTTQEIIDVSRFVADGGFLFAAGYAHIQRCFGYAIETDLRGQAVRGPDGMTLPETTGTLVEADPDSSLDLTDADVSGCAPVRITAVDTVLTTEAGAPVALTLTVNGAPRVRLLADHAFVTNRTLRTTDAGLVILPWLLHGDVQRIVFDEYHQGFGEGGSLFGATRRWLVTNPAGWAVLHAVAVALLALAVAAVRFGRPISTHRETRRSELEHLDALASGLHRSRSAGTAMQLIVRGLGRRLGRRLRSPADHAGKEGHRGYEAWLESLALVATSEEARDAAQRLTTIIRGGDATNVVAAANTVEELWNAMGSKTGPARS